MSRPVPRMGAAHWRPPKLTVEAGNCVAGPGLTPWWRSKPRVLVAATQRSELRSAERAGATRQEGIHTAPSPRVPGVELHILHPQLAGDELGQQCITHGGEGAGFSGTLDYVPKEGPRQLFKRLHDI